VDLGEVHAEDRVQRPPHLKCRPIRLAGLVPGGGQLFGRRDSTLLQPGQDRLDLPVAGGHLGLVDVIQLEGLGQGEDVLLPVVADQRLAHRLDRGMAPHVAVGGQDGWVALACDDRPDDAHARHARDVGHDVMQLQVHLGQRLLHVLDVRRRVVQQPLALPQVGAQSRHLGLRLEAWAQQAVFVQALQPFGVTDVGLAPWDVLGIPGVHQHHLEPTLLQDLVDRDPVDPGALHDDRLDAALGEPIGQPVEIGGEGLERPHRLLIAIRTDGGHVHGGADVDRRRVRVNRGQLLPTAGPLGLRHE